ncbi:MAG: hypothetical protein Q9182_003375 [Xanthomendoza sp. 2 TL-2023]
MYYRTVWLLHLLLQSSNAQLKPCFRWNGNYAEDFPCNPEAEVSACCGGDWICGTNLYCKNKNNGDLLIGTCTDRSWGSDNVPGCPFVLNAGKTVSNLDHFDYKLNTTRCTADDTLCPNNYFSKTNQTCCDRHQGKKEIFFQNNAVIPKAKAELSTYYASVGYTIPTDGVYKTELYSTATPITRSSNTITATGATSTGNSPSTPPPASPTATPSPGLSTGAKAGIGVGVALGVLIIAAAAAFLWMRRRKSMQSEREKQNLGGYSGLSQDPPGPHHHNQRPTTEYYKSSELGDGQPTMELDSQPYGAGKPAHHEMQG